jgi:Fic family protein
MASIIMRTKGKQDYHYLTHKTSIRQYEKYLGKKIPENIETIIKEFELEIFRKEKKPLLEKIKKNYSFHTKSVDPKILKSKHHGFKITHTYSTQRIEGSTMTLGQTKKLLEQKLSPKNTSVDDIIEAEQIAIIFDQMLNHKNNEISEKLILLWHEKLFEKTDSNNAGSFRREDVAPYMGKTEYVLWADVIPDIEGLLNWYKQNKKIINPVELASRFHKRFELIHPFIDGNGRIGRMIMLWILHKNGYPMMNIEPKEKDTYVKKLESSYLQSNELVFVKWFVLKYLRDHKKYIDE